MSAEAIENVEQPYPVTVVIARRYPVRRVILLIAAVLVLAGCSSHEAPASPQSAVFSHDLKAHSKTVREGAEGNTRKALEDARSRFYHRLSGPGQRGSGPLISCRRSGQEHRTGNRFSSIFIVRKLRHENSQKQPLR